MYYNTSIMTATDFILTLVIAGLCGWVASMLMGARRMNIFLLILLGFVGAWLGRWIATLVPGISLPSITIGGQSFPIVWTVIGSIVVVGLVSFIRQR